jgi:hypothetical protein
MRSGLAAEFDSIDELLVAIQQLQRWGYRLLDAHTPRPVPELSEVLELPRSRLGFVVCAAGMGGAAVGFFIMWYCNAWSYPINVGGRPAFAVPAFIPITFESGVLAAGTTAFVALLWRLGLPRLAHPLFRVDGFARASVDRYWLVIGDGDDALDPERTPGELRALGALRVAPFGALARSLGR